MPHPWPLPWCMARHVLCGLIFGVKAWNGSMMSPLRVNASTEPGVRQRMSGSELAARTQMRRDSVQDRSVTSHRRRTTGPISMGNVAIVARRSLLVATRNLLAVRLQILNPGASRTVPSVWSLP